ncbi:uncharacterized protein NECHADRAFT_82927 [Fusarium vanettenii 77-13-4]|uniref:Zn(2)-C6 fungal-type domain-containing protein n=1 Tax=Fusarium vanettenii (strain ATCC MYA-4622 / CBS 123669 / FGSC 9596 / NRRL 45880 / 77-13-4) TaxID=660122 RepID=C7YX85_FUSV7|nr:uncharacterized protein NECHADRAFT_82927 [Fusarium vanettenii 77-13-4]EEU43543.1 predicted protein [Fusarium vanettenii 77-13-4]
MSNIQHESHNRAPRLQTRFRSSCDACGQAKIKCDRGRPACSRCIAQGLGCVYGVSRKAGKPPRRRLASPLQVRSSPGMPEIPEIGLTCNDQGDLDMMLGLAESNLILDDPFSTSHDIFQPWLSLNNLESPAILEPAERSTATTPPITAARQFCTQESKDIMRRLYCANPSAPISDGVPARTLDLDSVLTRNRDVVGRLGLLLKCPLSRVLLWYKQAISNTNDTGMSYPPTPGAPGSTTSSTSGDSLSSSGAGATSDKMGVSVLRTALTVGTFQSHDHDLQAALTNTLIQSELKRVGSLITVFLSLGTETYDPGAACPAAEELGTNLADKNLVASLGAWLQTEYRGIVAKARSSSTAVE